MTIVTDCLPDLAAVLLAHPAGPFVLVGTVGASAAAGWGACTMRGRRNNAASTAAGDIHASSAMQDAIATLDSIWPLDVLDDLDAAGGVDLDAAVLAVTATITDTDAVDVPWRDVPARLRAERASASAHDGGSVAGPQSAIPSWLQLPDELPLTAQAPTGTFIDPSQGHDGAFDGAPDPGAGDVGSLPWSVAQDMYSPVVEVDAHDEVVEVDALDPFPNDLLALLRVENHPEPFTPSPDAAISMPPEPVVMDPAPAMPAAIAPTAPTAPPPIGDNVSLRSSGKRPSARDVAPPTPPNIGRHVSFRSSGKRQRAGGGAPPAVAGLTRRAARAAAQAARTAEKSAAAARGAAGRATVAARKAAEKDAAEVAREERAMRRRAEREGIVLVDASVPEGRDDLNAIARVGDPVDHVQYGLPEPVPYAAG
jgi:hypothetical protein